MSGETQGRTIFISYRRDDSEGESGRLYDDLVRAYGEDKVFMDVAGIQPGIDFRKAIDDNVASCGVQLAVIGPTWATLTGRDGTRRLDNPDDYVRLEIGSALKRGIPVIPVLVHDARMPGLDQLPDNLKDLRYRNSVELTHARWNSDVALLVSALKSYVGAAPADPNAPVHAALPVQLPAPQSEPAAPAAKKSRVPLLAGLAALAVIAVAWGVFAVVHNKGGAQQPIDPALTGGGATATAPPSTATGSQPASTVAGAETALLGKWKNSIEAPGADDLEQITVADIAGQLTVQAWGQCKGHLCNWGVKNATLNGTQATTESWDLRNTPKEEKQQRSATLSISPAGSGLAVSVKNVYRQPDGQAKESINQLQFEKMQ